MNISSLRLSLALFAAALSLLALFSVSPSQAENSPYPVNAGPFMINQPPIKKDYDNTSLHIISASYGLNCNLQLSAKSVEADALIKDNNVFEKISRMCEKETNCSQLVTEEGMGYNATPEKDPQITNPPPAPGCAKELVVDYACSPTDSTHTARMQDGGMLVINCASEN